jgi:hypothetical protein
MSAPNPEKRFLVRCLETYEVTYETVSPDGTPDGAKLCVLEDQDKCSEVDRDFQGANDIDDWQVEEVPDEEAPAS